MNYTSIKYFDKRQHSAIHIGLLEQLRYPEQLIILTHGMNLQYNVYNVVHPISI